MPCWASGMSGKAAILLGGNGGENVRSEKNEHLLKPKGEWGKKLSTGLVRVRIRVNPNQGPVGGAMPRVGVSAGDGEGDVVGPLRVHPDGHLAPLPDQLLLSGRLGAQTEMNTSKKSWPFWSVVGLISIRLRITGDQATA